MLGVPASLTSAIFLPFCNCVNSVDARLFSLCFWSDIKGVLISNSRSNNWVTRVSSAAIRSTCVSVSISRNVQSLKFPIGVAHTNSVPTGVLIRVLPQCGFLQNV